MVGTDPAAGSVTTHVPVELIPLSLQFQGKGCVLQDSQAVPDLLASPLFAGTAGVGTQYVDLLQRANFWSAVGTVSPGWNLVLDPAALPAVTLHVPASQGVTFDDPSCDPVCGVVGGEWLERQLFELLNSLHISPTTLAVFVPVNTFVTDDNPEDCLEPAGCATYDGYHYATFSPRNPHAINSFVMAEYIDDPQVPPPYDFGAYTLSHELLEWANNPFDNEGRLQGELTFFSNPAPGWSSPYFRESTTCQTILEVADPLEGAGAAAVAPVGSPTPYALADEAFLSWFARQSPSTAFGGLYDAFGLFSTYSTAC
jgi:hypothetical protein